MFGITKAKRFTPLISVLIIAVIMLQGFTIVTTASNEYTATTIALTPGRNPSELNFAWYSSENPAASVVQIAKKSDMTGSEFPVEKAETFIGTASPAAEGFATNKVTVANLSPSTEYVYRIGDGSDANWSPVYSYTTRNPDDFGFFFVADPQIGYSNTARETEQWKDTVSKASNKFPNASFMLCAGDIVQKNGAEHQYAAFFEAEELRSLPVAPVQGNHDADNPNFAYHFNMPNQSEYGKTTKGGDDGNYYFVYGNTLFMFLNTNYKGYDKHNIFMRETVAANPGVKWKVVMFHHSIYSSGSHWDKDYTKNMRNTFTPVFDELGVDLVLMGHDHVYVRTYHMLNNQPQKDQAVDAYGRVINPIGTLYLTGNSSTGSKYYEIVADPEYAAVNSQLEVPTFTYIHINSGSLSLETYRTDTMEVTDAYTILKSVPIDGAEGLSLESLNFKKGDVIITSISHPGTGSGGEIYAAATLSNSAPVSHTAVLGIARYSDSGRLLDLKFSEPAAIPAYEGETGGSVKKVITTPAINVPSVHTGEYLKMFLWNSIESCIPYIPAKELHETPPEPTPPPTPTPTPTPEPIRYECEELVVGEVSGGAETNIEDSEASGGAINLFEANDIGDYIQYDVELPSSGTWNISLVVKNDKDRGKFKLFLPQSGKYVGSGEYDQYSTDSSYSTIYIGQYKFNSGGIKQFRFIVTGKNENSEGYTLGNDAIIISK